MDFLLDELAISDTAMPKTHRFSKGQVLPEGKVDPSCRPFDSPVNIWKGFGADVGGPITVENEKDSLVLRRNSNIT